MASRPSRVGERCAGLLLAAGAGTRLGTPKGHVILGGNSLARRGVRLLSDAGCDPVHAVVQAPLPRDVPPDIVRTVDNPAWQSGMGSSLRAGLASLADTAARACVVALVDQPFVSHVAVQRLIAAWAADGAVAACATYNGWWRNPVLLDRSVWDAVSSVAHGDQGARAWLRANAALVAPVACDDVGDPFDIDTREDLASAEAQLQQAGRGRST